MGELSGNGGGIQGEKLSGDHAAVEPTPTDVKGSGEAPVDGSVDKKPTGVPTDVDGIYADALKNDMPVFDVSPEEFNNNMKMDRRRLRFKKGSKAAEYMRNTRYNRPFWIRNSQDGYLRKISK